MPQAGRRLGHQSLGARQRQPLLFVGLEPELRDSPPRQIVLFVGFLEWWSEFAPEVHCTKNEG